MKTTFPNLIIPGAPKSGTSSLYFWLAAHPQCCASKVKETFFFADDVNRFNKGLNFIESDLKDYSTHFSHCSNEKVIFEATAPYIYFENAIKGIAQLPKTPSLIFILREPSQRLYSKYKFHKYKLKIFSGSFNDFVSLEGAKFSGRHVEEGKYIEYLKKWLKVFPREKILVLGFGELLKNRVEVMHRVSDFLNIDASFYDNFNFMHRNETVKLRSKMLHQLGLKIQKFIPYGVQDRLLPLYMKLNSGQMPGKSPGEAELIAELKKFYSSYNRRLKEEFEYLNLTNWAI